MKILSILALSLLSINTCFAEVNAFVEADTILTYSGDTQSTKYPTGNYPFIGKVGLEYTKPKSSVSYQLGVIHRSNVDLTWAEYYYNGIFVGVILKHCILKCN